MSSKINQLIAQIISQLKNKITASLVQIVNSSVKQNVSINSLQNDKQNLAAQVSTLKQKITHLTTQYEKKLSELTTQKIHLSSRLQCESKKKEQNLKQIGLHKQSIQKLIEEKANLKMQVQKLQMQRQSDIKHQDELKQSLRQKENQILSIKIDYDTKLQIQNDTNAAYQTQIKSLSDNVNDQDKKIKVMEKQIEGLKNQKKQMENHIITLEKIQTQKIALNQKIIQLNNKIKQLEQKIIQNDRQTVRLTSSTGEKQRDYEKEKRKLKQQTTKIKTYYEQLGISLAHEYETQKNLFINAATKKMDQVIKSFNQTNLKLKEDKNKSRQQSLKLSTYLVSIYQAQNQMNKFYQLDDDKQINNSKILESVNNGKILDENQCKQVLLYTVKTIKMLQKNNRQLINVCDEKIKQLRIMIDNLRDQKELKTSLQSFAKYRSKKQQNTDLVDEVSDSFNAFVSKISKFIKEEQQSASEIVNKLVYDNQNNQQLYKQQIKKLKTKYETQVSSQLKGKDTQINNLKGQITNLNSQLKTKEDLIKQHLSQIKKLTQDLKRQRDQRQQSSLNAHKNFKLVRDQLQGQKQKLNQQVYDLSIKLASAESKITKLQREISESQASHGRSSDSLTAARDQITSLKQKLEEKQTQLRKTIDQLKMKKSQLKTKQQVLLKTNTTISELQQNITKQSSRISILQNQLKVKQKEINDLIQQLNELSIQYQSKMQSLKAELAQTKAKLLNVQSQLKQEESIIFETFKTLSQKVNRKIAPQKLAQQIQLYQPPVGQKLIFSGILHGNDMPRSQIIQQIQKFTQKKLRRTDLLVRYPDVKSMIHQLPKQTNNFAFVLMFRTAKGFVFGSFSEGLKKPTFVFNFNPFLEDQEKQVKFFTTTRSPQSKISSVEMFQGKYLQYGNGELRINCIDMSTISAYSDITENMYYSLDWRVVMNEQSELKVQLSEVELHKVEFE